MVLSQCPSKIEQSHEHQKGAPKSKDKDQEQKKSQSQEGSLPPSSSSSPSHEFSFTISLQPPNKWKPTAPSFELDLCPADEIFFHGHLLPLHLLSHASISPRSSTSFNDFNLPPPNYSNDEKIENNSNGSSSSSNCTNTSISYGYSNGEVKERIKPKSFSLPKLTKWRKALETGERWEEKKKVKFEVSRVLKKYVKAVMPFLFFNGGSSKDKCAARRQPHSFSGTLNPMWKEGGGRRLGGFSAPASMRTSPTNSGLLVATASISSSHDSTMEELQSAIQAAIAHCKNSIAVKEDKCKCSQD